MESFIIHPVFDYYGCYPETGEICCIKTMNKIKGTLNKGGYRSCNVRSIDKKIKKTLYVHCFIWTCINGEIPKGYEIDHINNDKCDNKLSNLRCVTLEENRKEKKGLNGHLMKKNIKAINVDTNEVFCFTSKYECAKYFDISTAMIYLIVEKKNNTKRANTNKGKFTFEYVENDDIVNLVNIPRKKNERKNTAKEYKKNIEGCSIYLSKEHAMKRLKELGIIMDYMNIKDEISQKNFYNLIEKFKKD